MQPYSQLKTFLVCLCMHLLVTPCSVFCSLVSILTMGVNVSSCGLLVCWFLLSLVRRSSGRVDVAMGMMAKMAAELTDCKSCYFHLEGIMYSIIETVKWSGRHHKDCVTMCWCLIQACNVIGLFS